MGQGGEHREAAGPRSLPWLLLPRLHLPASTVLAACSHVHSDTKTAWLVLHSVSVVLVRTKHTGVDNLHGATVRFPWLCGRMACARIYLHLKLASHDRNGNVPAGHSNGSFSFIETAWSS